MHKYKYKRYGDNRLKNLWAIDQTDAETSTVQHAHSQETNFSASAAEYDHAIPTSEQLQTHALESPALESVLFCIKMLMIIIILHFIDPLLVIDCQIKNNTK